MWLTLSSVNNRLFRKLLGVSFVLLSFSGVYILPNISVFTVSYFVLLLLIMMVNKLRFEYASRWNLVIIYILVIAVYNGSYEIMTFLYGLSFILFFVLFQSFDGRMRIDTLTKIIFWSYFFCTLMGQMYVWFGLLGSNDVNEFGLSFGKFGSLYQLTLDTYRQMSLATEPAHASFCVSIITSVIFRQIGLKRNVLSFTYITAYVYMMIAFNSTSGLLLFPLPFVSLFEKRKILFFILAFSGIALVTLFIPAQAERILGLLSSFNSIKEMEIADGSGFYRVAPQYYYLQEFNFFDFSYWFGNGINASNNYYSRLLVPSGQYTISVPLFPSVLYDYGIFGLGLLFWAIGKGFSVKGNIAFVVYGLFGIFNLNFNTQLFWLYLIIFWHLSRTSLPGDVNYKTQRVLSLDEK